MTKVRGVLLWGAAGAALRSNGLPERKMGMRLGARAGRCSTGRRLTGVSPIMTNILVALFFLAVVVVPAIAALMPVQDEEAAAKAISSLKPALSPAGEAFGAEKAAQGR
jgi:hypothetical protein